MSYKQGLRVSKTFKLDEQERLEKFEYIRLQEIPLALLSLISLCVVVFDSMPFDGPTSTYNKIFYKGGSRKCSTRSVSKNSMIVIPSQI